jgi:dTDP-4-dehydrorhamnose 3,5-epimerase
MKFIRTALAEVVLIQPDVYADPRGFLVETYRAELYAAEAGIDGVFVQDNVSRSNRNTVRGLHAQWRRPQGKLLRVTRGEIFDVSADIRVGSPTYRKWVGVTLSADECRLLYIPPGFAHGFCVMSDVAEVEYKCTDYYDPEGELRILWNDPSIGIRWPIREPVLSEKDRSAKRLDEVVALLPKYGETQR